VVIAEVWGGSRKQPGKCVYQLSSLVEVSLVTVFAKSTLHSRCTHKVHSGGCDDFNGWNFCDVANLVGDIPEF
jgi:hypothetical protein